MRAYAVSATVTNGSPNVTCAGAALLANAYEGDSLLLPNGTSWPIKSVNSNTSLTLEGNFVGTGGTYAAFITRRNDAWVSSAQVNLKYSQALEALLRGYTLTSPTSLAIGAGSKAFTTQGDAPILPGARVRASSNANPTTHWMEGVVTAYAGGVMTLSVDVFAGSGSRADWSLNLSGTRGAIGAAVSVPVSTTIDNIVGWNAANGGALKDMGSFASLLTSALVAAAQRIDNLELGHASDTTLTRAAAGQMQVEGQRVYQRNNILGTVSQSGGVPTGSIIERGSNGNGEYVRHADGTQICAVAFQGASTSGTRWDKTLPASFANDAYLAVGAEFQGSSFTRRSAFSFGGNASLLSLYAQTGDSATLTYPVRVLAFGRWF